MKSSTEKHLTEFFQRLLSSPTFHVIMKTLKEDPARCDPFGYDAEFTAIMRPLFQFLYHRYFRVTVRGSKGLPSKGPALLVANHSGAIPYDGAMLGLTAFNELKKPRTVRFLVDDFVSELPWLGKGIERLGGIRASQENAAQLLEAGHLVAVFPEGLKGVGKPYDEKYRLQRFGRGGFVRLAMRTKTTIIPTAIIGAEEVHPIVGKVESFAKPLGIPYIPITPTFPWLGPLGAIPLPSKWEIVFGKPVSFAKARARDAENEELVQQHAASIQGTIQKMIRVALKKRKSVWG